MYVALRVYYLPIFGSIVDRVWLQWFVGCVSLSLLLCWEEGMVGSLGHPCIVVLVYFVFRAGPS